MSASVSFRYLRGGSESSRIRFVPDLARVSVFFVVGTLLPAVWGMLFGHNDPHGFLVHDEHAYLLQADTFSAGRITNPSPPLPAFFEAPHVLVEPSYQGKYFPANGALLALGQRLAGHPIAGVWLGCGAFAAAVFWTLSAGVGRSWAILGTVHAMVGAGIAGYWAQSYWGGMVPAIGGALVLGGTIRILQEWRVSDAIAIGGGGAILLLSRPFEGSILGVTCIMFILGRVFRDVRTIGMHNVAKCCIACCFVFAVLGIGPLLAWNRAVTGRWWRPPYAEHHERYFGCGFLHGQTDAPTAPAADPQLAEWYRKASAQNPNGRAVTAALNWIRILVSQPARLFAVGLQISPKDNAERLLLVATCAACFWLLVAWTLTRDNAGMPFRLALALVLADSVVGAISRWELPHYRAGVTSAYEILLTTMLRELAAAGVSRRVVPRGWLQGIFVSLLVGIIAARCDRAITSQRILRATSPARQEYSTADAGPALPMSRADAWQFLSRRDRPVVVFVSGEEGFNWVFNESDISSARVLWVHDFGDAANADLADHFPGRETWSVVVERHLASAIERRSYPSPARGGD